MKYYAIVAILGFTASSLAFHYDVEGIYSRNAESDYLDNKLLGRALPPGGRLPHIPLDGPYNAVGHMQHNWMVGETPEKERTAHRTAQRVTALELESENAMNSAARIRQHNPFDYGRISAANDHLEQTKARHQAAMDATSQAKKDLEDHTNTISSLDRAGYGPRRRDLLQPPSQLRRRNYDSRSYAFSSLSRRADPRVVLGLVQTHLNSIQPQADLNVQHTLVQAHHSQALAHQAQLQAIIAKKPHSENGPYNRQAANLAAQNAAQTKGQYHAAVHAHNVAQESADTQRDAVIGIHGALNGP